MANSARFRELRQRLTALRRHMLPGTFSPTGDYSDRQLDRVRGYRLLAHAEIESFIEDITLSTAMASVRSWVTSKKPSDVLICMIAHYHHGYDQDGEGLQPSFPEVSRPKVGDAVKEVVEVALRQYVKIHNQNHGVREANLKRLVLPIGVRKDALDPTWLTNLDEFGKRRGDVAHKSLKAQQQIDPRAEFQAITDLLVGLEQLDQLVRELSN